MSKELEALNGIKMALAKHLSKQTGLSVEKHFELLDYDTQIDIVKKALTPPTAEEVCKALEDYLDFAFFDTKCVFKDNAFREESYGELIEVLIDYQNVIYFYVDLPPHIVEMVARFYKTLDKEIKTIEEMKE